MTFEEIGDETYIILEGETIGRIVPYEQQGVYIIFEGSSDKIAKHSVEEAKGWVRRDYQDYLETLLD